MVRFDIMNEEKLGYTEKQKKKVGNLMIKLWQKLKTRELYDLVYREDLGELKDVPLEDLQRFVVIDDENCNQEERETGACDHHFRVDQVMDYDLEKQHGKYRFRFYP